MVSDLFFLCVVAIGTSFLQQAEAGYARTLNLDFLCSTSETAAYVRHIPWDCSSYVICMSGQAIPTACPHGKLYGGTMRNSKCEPASDVDTSRCLGQIWNYLQTICQHNPGATIADSEKCAQYFDCSLLDGSQEYMDYLVECPYPTMFSTQTGKCQDYRHISCGERKEPKAPCEYLQYLQLYDCGSLDCPLCKKHHPSCVGLLNGRQPVPLRTDIMMECDRERTLNIISTSATPINQAAPTPVPVTIRG